MVKVTVNTFVWRIVALYGDMTGDIGMTNRAVSLDINTPLSVSLVSNMSCICQFGK